MGTLSGTLDLTPQGGTPSKGTPSAAECVNGQVRRRVCPLPNCSGDPLYPPRAGYGAYGTYAVCAW